MSSCRFTFSKSERLCSKKIIEDIFQRKGSQQFLCFPILVSWKFITLPATSPAQVLFSIPKKKFKKAKDRNRIRRQLREIYRLHKNPFYELLNTKNLQCAVVISYIAKEKLPYRQLENAFQKCIQQIIANVPQNSGDAHDRNL